MNKQVYEIDGNNSSNLEEFAVDFTHQLNLEIGWRGNLDAFNDILHGGFGTPDGGFILVWRNAELSRQRLGYPETIKWLEERIQNCHPSNIKHFKQRLKLAQQNKGKTLFDMLVEIITDEDHKGIELRLE